MASSSMPWIKIYTDILDDPKIGRLSASTKWHFVALCTLAGECDAEGYLVNGDEALTVDDIAWRLREDRAELASSMEALNKIGLLSIDDKDVWFVTNFAKRQGRSQSEKRAAWRERKNVQRKDLRPTVFERASGRCEYCGQPLDEETWVVDHIIPPEKGGNSELDNLAASCPSCNTKKAGRTPDDAGMALCGGSTATEVSQPCPNLVPTLSEPCPSSREEKSREEKSREEGEKSKRIYAGNLPAHPPGDPDSLEKPTSKTKVPVPEAIKVFRQNAHRYPAKSWYGDVVAVVGRDPPDLERWGQVVKEWVGNGWNPTNIRGMLDKFQGKTKDGTTLENGRKVITVS